jgi:predicted Zn-ribbon and HTH transcriptional regulator
MKIADAKTKRLLTWLDRIIDELDKQDTTTPAESPPKCGKCGQVKSYDLFKGEHCSRCNDWC